MITNPSMKTGGKDGIALIVVLGFLAMLVILAVGFIINVRTERITTNYFVENQKAKMAVSTAFVYALEDLDSTMETDGRVYPRFSDATPDVLQSYENGQATNAIDVMLFPDDAYSNLTASARSQVASVLSDTDWIYYLNDTSGKPETRFFYIIVNCSGALDANKAGATGVSRGTGTNACEIDLDVITDVDAVTFLSDRQTFGKYYSLADLDAAINASVLHHFQVFSCAPQGFQNAAGSVSPQIYVATKEAVGTNDIQIIATFTDELGFAAVEAQLLYDGLLDYVDEDFENTRGIDEISTEPIPMINEISVEVDKISVELWNPYVEAPSPLAVRLKGIVTYERTIAPDMYSHDVDIGTVDVKFKDTMPKTFDNIAPFDYIAGGYASPPNMVKADLSVEVEHNGDTYDIDHVAMPSLNLNQTYECLEPRYNHDALFWRTIPSADKTDNAINTWASDAVDGYLNPVADGDWQIYIANGPITNVGELARLQYGPWQTLKIYGASALPVFDCFTTVTNEALFGLVNVNTLDAEVMKAVFSKTPVRQYPGDPNAKVLQDEPLNQLVATLIAANAETTLKSKCDMAKLIDDSYFSANFLAPDTLNELEKESLLINSMDLFSIRHNLFNVILVAQSGRTDEDGNFNPMATSKAMALVWRDPFSVDGQYEKILRYFRWLDE